EGCARLVRSAQEAEQLARMEGELGEPNPHCVVDRVRDRRDDGMKRTFARLLGAVRPLWISGLDDHRGELRRVETGRNPVIEERWTAVETRGQIGHLLHSCFGVATIHLA